MKIYIAGRITGNENAEEEFRTAEIWLLSLGHVPLNPMKNVGFDYKDYIDMGLMELSKCDAMFVLDNKWHHSEGVNLERHYAKTVGIRVLHENISIHSDLLKRCKSVGDIENFFCREEKERWLFGRK